MRDDSVDDPNDYDPVPEALREAWDIEVRLARGEEVSETDIKRMHKAILKWNQDNLSKEALAELHNTGADIQMNEPEESGKQPNESWKLTLSETLEQTLESVEENHHNWSRPSRRSMATGVHIPSSERRCDLSTLSVMVDMKLCESHEKLVREALEIIENLCNSSVLRDCLFCAYVDWDNEVIEQHWPLSCFINKCERDVDISSRHETWADAIATLSGPQYIGDHKLLVTLESNRVSDIPWPTDDTWSIRCIHQLGMGFSIELCDK